jgi:hypothetical protein
MPSTELRQQITQLCAQLAGRELNAELDLWLNTEHGVGTASYRRLRESCEAGVAAGWLCNREGGGIRYGRIFKPAPDLRGFSVDVVDMKNIAGPHHTHPQGEIDLIMPIDEAAQFDDRPAGWLVYPPGSAHHPTVTQGRALILYLLPNGEIHFTPEVARPLP